MKNNLINTKYIAALCAVLGLTGCVKNVKQSEPYKEKTALPTSDLDTCLVSGVFDSQKTEGAPAIRMINKYGVVYELSVRGVCPHYNQRGDTVIYDTSNNKIVKNLTLERIEKNFIKSR